MQNKFTAAVGQKFHEDGQARHFPGNTIITHLVPHSVVYTEAVRAQTEIMRLPFSDKYGFLPAPSFHMTVFELLGYEIQKPEFWTSHFGSDVSLKELDEYFSEKMEEVSPPEEIRMRYIGFNLERWVVILLEPADEETERELKEYREEASRVTGIRSPNHDTYWFHITLAYLLRHLDKNEAVEAKRLEDQIGARLSQRIPEIRLPTPKVTFFDNMFAFHHHKERTSRWRRL